MIESVAALLSWVALGEPRVAALLLLAVRGSLAVAGAALLALCLRRASAATRRHVWALATIVLLAVGLVGAVSLLGPQASAPRWVPRASAEAAPPPVFVRDDGEKVLLSESASTDGSPWLIVWGLPAILLLGRHAMAHLRAGALTRRARPLASECWCSDAERVSRARGVRTPRLLLTTESDSPLTVGLLRSRVLVPESMLASPPTLRRAILLHEIAHVHGRDVLTRTLAACACALHWFNPLVWLLARRLRLEGERAGDDAVLVGGVSPARYARQLLRLAPPGRGRSLSPAVATGLGSSELFRRIRGIEDPGAARREPPPAIVAVIAAIAVLQLLILFRIGLPQPEFRFVPEGASLLAPTPGLAPPGGLRSPTEAPPDR